MRQQTLAKQGGLRNDKAAIEKLNARLDDLNKQAESLQSLVGVISAIQDENLSSHVLDATQTKELCDCLENCGHNLSDLSLSDSDVANLKTVMNTSRFEATAKWKEAATTQASDVYNSLNSLMNLLPDRQAASTVLHTLSLSKDSLPTSAQGVSVFKGNVSKARAMVNSLNLSDPSVRNFITRVQTGQATLTDLNEHALQWLKDNHLTGKLKISF